MATRAIRLTQYAVIRPFTVKAASTVRQGYPVKNDTGTVVECTAIADNCLGISVETEDGTWPAGAGDTVGVALLGTNAVVPVLTGTATIAAIGDFVTVAHATTNGCRTATVGGGTNKCVVYGQALQVGASGDLVGVNLACASATVGS